MNPLFAAGLFDSPWIVAALVIGSALANWVAKRRQEKQGRPSAEGDEPAPASHPPPSEFNLEETLRRLLGEEPPTPPRPPPLIPPPAQHELPPARPRSEEKPPLPDWTQRNQAEEANRNTRRSAQPSTPVLRPPMGLPPGSATSRAASRQEAQAAQRFEQLNEQGRHPATVVNHGRQRSGRVGPRSLSRWRDVRSVRQAFVTSLVFAPPKSFEP